MKKNDQLKELRAKIKSKVTKLNNSKQSVVNTFIKEQVKEEDK